MSNLIKKVIGRYDEGLQSNEPAALNKEISSKSDRVFGGHYEPKPDDLPWKYKVADQMNKMLCLVVELPDNTYRDDLRDLVDRVGEFEDIPFLTQEANPQIPAS